MSEAAVLLVSIPTSDTLTMSDDNAVLATGLNKEDSVVVSEVLAKSFTAEKSDAVSLTEAPVLTSGLSKTDTISMSESFSRVVNFIREFTDSFTLDDLASVDDPLQTDVGLDKTNITTLNGRTYLFSFKGFIRLLHNYRKRRVVVYQASLRLPDPIQRLLLYWWL